MNIFDRLKLFLAISLLICIFMMVGCGASNNDVPLGYIDKAEHYQEGGFQDYTDYCKYMYESSDAFVENNDYVCVEAEEIDGIKKYFYDFESWMREANRSDEYDFDDICINPGDYIRIIKSEATAGLEDYTIYFFDMETFTLYYLHNNI